ncbi:MAG: integrase arm-type DNA-binding domain-containing protein [Burkholderiales bacterium]|nr:integrase arm-type DNA-binding domain-containing protein [Burkholderiales bacterium]
MAQKLTELAVKNAKATGKARKIADAHGLYLHVEPTGAKYWRYRYRTADGRERVAALGVYPVLSLADARKAHADARKALANGLDPVQQKREAKALSRTSAESTFEAIARQWHDETRKTPPSDVGKRRGWTPDNAVRILRRMEAHLFPMLGSLPVAEVSAQRVLDTLRKLEAAGKHETASRCLEYTKRTLRYASKKKLVSMIVTDAIASDDLQGVSTRNHPRVKPEEIGALLRAIDASNLHPTTRLALALVFQSAVRTTEARAARWVEFDLDDARWTIPAERMKMKIAHIVPLSRQAVATLRELQQHTGHGDLLFPNQARPLVPMSENAMLYALNRAGYAGRQTVHGIRGLFSTTANESGKWDQDVIELCLAHKDKDKIRSAYNSAQRLPDRAKLLQWWADHLDTARAGATIIEFRKAV